MDEHEYVTFTTARQMIGVGSKDTLRRIVNREGWTVYNNPADRRESWLRRSDVERYAMPRPRQDRPNAD